MFTSVRKFVCAAVIAAAAVGRVAAPAAASAADGRAQYYDIWKTSNGHTIGDGSRQVRRPHPEGSDCHSDGPAARRLRRPLHILADERNDYYVRTVCTLHIDATGKDTCLGNVHVRYLPNGVNDRAVAISIYKVGADINDPSAVALIQFG
jgi:hypothetical protein